MLWEDGRGRLNQKARESPLVEWTSKLSGKAFTRQRRIEKSVSDRVETILGEKMHAFALAAHTLKLGQYRED